ncbi:hypothetical protein [Candidatus Nitrosocosmicus sp. T]
MVGSGTKWHAHSLDWSLLFIPPLRELYPKEQFVKSKAAQRTPRPISYASEELLTRLSDQLGAILCQLP